MFIGVPFIAPRGNSRVDLHLPKMCGNRHDVLPFRYSSGTSAREVVAKLKRDLAPASIRMQATLLGPES